MLHKPGERMTSEPAVPDVGLVSDGSTKRLDFPQDRKRRNAGCFRPRGTVPRVCQTWWRLPDDGRQCGSQLVYERYAG